MIKSEPKAASVLELKFFVMEEFMFGKQDAKVQEILMSNSPYITWIVIVLMMLIIDIIVCTIDSRRLSKISILKTDHRYLIFAGHAHSCMVEHLDPQISLIYHRCVDYLH